MKIEALLEEIASKNNVDSMARWLISAVENYKFVYGKEPSPEVMQSILNEAHEQHETKNVSMDAIRLVP